MHGWSASEHFRNFVQNDAHTLGATEVPYQYDAPPDGPTETIGDPQGDVAFNHLQGENPYRFQGDCGLVSSQDILNQFGIPVTESDVVQHAVEHGECTITSDLSEAGGTSPEQQVQVLGDYGIPAHVEQQGTLDSLAEHIQNGQGAIIGVNAGYLWHDANSVGNGEPNHAITVTGVARDPQTGQIQGFYISDSGTGKSDMFVSAQTMQHVWVDTGGTSVVTDIAH